MPVLDRGLQAHRALREQFEQSRAWLEAAADTSGEALRLARLRLADIVTYVVTAFQLALAYPGEDGFGLSVRFELLERFRAKERQRDTLRSLVGWR